MVDGRMPAPAPGTTERPTKEVQLMGMDDKVKHSAERGRNGRRRIDYPIVQARWLGEGMLRVHGL